MTAQLQFSGVSKWFESSHGVTHAVDKVSFTIEPGDFVAIVGPSGCGKSTLLHIAAGLDTQHDGEFNRTPDEAVGACLFQSPRLLPWLTARKNISFVLQAHGDSGAIARQRADDMLATVGLAGFAGYFPGQLSGGMQQRVALGRALAVDPDALLMDEPFSALDELTARRLRGELLELYDAKHRTVLFVTHNINEACYLADRVIVMSPHPGSVLAEVAVPARRPRSYDDAALGEIAAKILALIEDDADGEHDAGSDHG